MPVIGHVESHVAARMRRRGLSEGEVVLNNVTCGNRGFDKDYPETAKIEQFLKLVDDPSTGKFYVHCAGGRHRTGVMAAVYRFNHYNWNYDQVYAEMKKYDFYTRWGHGDMKKFVQDYAANLTNKNAVVVTTSNANQK